MFIAHQRKLDDILKLLITAGASPLTENELLNSATLKSKIFNNIESSIDYTKRNLWPKIAIVIVIICFGWWLFSGGHSSSSSSNSSSSTPNSESTIQIGTGYDCPHCFGTGQRVNNITGIRGECSSCGGKGTVSKEQYDHLSK